MKKFMRITAVLAIFTLCLGAAACGGSNEDADPIDEIETTVSDSENGDETTPEDTAEAEKPAAKTDLKSFAGIWLGEVSNDYDYIKIDENGKWELYLADDVTDSGEIRYSDEWEGYYAYSDADGSGGRAVIQDDGRLYITTLGYFNPGEEMVTIWYSDGCNVELTDLQQ